MFFFFKLSVKDEGKIIYLDMYLLLTKLQRVIYTIFKSAQSLSHV